MLKLKPIIELFRKRYVVRFRPRSLFTFDHKHPCCSSIPVPLANPCAFKAFLSMGRCWPLVVRLLRNVHQWFFKIWGFVKIWNRLYLQKSQLWTMRKCATPTISRDIKLKLWKINLLNMVIKVDYWNYVPMTWHFCKVYICVSLYLSKYLQ